MTRFDITFDNQMPVPSSGPTSNRGRGFLAVCASVFLPGSGHMLVGRRARGWRWFVVWIGLTFLTVVCLIIPRLVPALIVLIPALLVFMPAVCIDAYRCANKSHNPLLTDPVVRYAMGVLVLLLSAIISPTVIAAFLVHTFLVDPLWMPNSSMSPTILPGDLILLHKTRSLQRWSIVAFNPPGDPEAARPGLYVFRVAGLPREQLEIAGGQVYINGSAVPSPPVVAPYSGFRRLAGKGNPIALRTDEYFLLGDNSAIAGDSRITGQVPAVDIEGCVTTIIWPPSRWRRLE